MTSNDVKVVNFDELINNEDNMNSSSNGLDTPTYSNPLSATNLFVLGFLAIVFTPLAITQLITYK